MFIHLLETQFVLWINSCGEYYLRENMGRTIGSSSVFGCQPGEWWMVVLTLSEWYPGDVERTGRRRGRTPSFTSTYPFIPSHLHSRVFTSSSVFILASRKNCLWHIFYILKPNHLPKTFLVINKVRLLWIDRAQITSSPSLIKALHQVWFVMNPKRP